MDDTDEQVDLINNIQSPAEEANVVGNVRSDTPVVQGVFSRKIVAKASKNIRQMKNLNDQEVSNDGEDLLEKSRMHRSNSRMNHLSRVPVSSRFDVLLSSNLFQKYLGPNHENILERIYKQRGGVFSGGMRKAYSNVDLTNIDLSQTFDSPLSNNPKSASFSTADKRNESYNGQGNGQNKDTTRRRRVSISSGQEVQDIVDELAGAKREVTINGQRTHAVTAISSRGKRQKFNVPSFSEFRKQRQMRIASGHQYAKEAKSLLNNNQSAVRLPEVTSQSLAEASVLMTAVSLENSESAEHLHPITEDEQKNSVEQLERVEPKTRTIQCDEQLNTCAVGNNELDEYVQGTIPVQLELRETTVPTPVPREKGEMPSLERCYSVETEDLGGIKMASGEIDSVKGENSECDKETSVDSAQETAGACVINSGEVTNVSLPTKVETPSVPSRHNSGEITQVSLSLEEEETPSELKRQISGEVTNCSFNKKAKNSSLSCQHNSIGETSVFTTEEGKITPSLSSQHNSREVTNVTLPAETETSSMSSQNSSEEVTGVSVPREGGCHPSESSLHSSGEITSAIETDRNSDSQIPKDVVLALMGSSMETQMSDEVFDDEEENSDLIPSKKPPINISLQESDPEKCDLELDKDDKLVLEDLDTPTNLRMCNMKSDPGRLSLSSSVNEDTCGMFTFTTTETSEVKENFITLEVPSESSTDDIIDIQSTGDRDCGLFPEKKVAELDASDGNTEYSEPCNHESVVMETVSLLETSESYEAPPVCLDKNEIDEEDIDFSNTKEESIENKDDIKVDNISCDKPASPEKPKILPRIPKRQTKPVTAPRPVPRSRPVNDPSRSQIVQTGIRPRKRKLPTRPPRVSRTKSDCNMNSATKEAPSVLVTSWSLDSEQVSQVQEVISEVNSHRRNGSDDFSQTLPSSPSRTESSPPPLPSSPPPNEPSTPPLPSSPPPSILIPSSPDDEPSELYVKPDDATDGVESPTLPNLGETKTSSVPFLSDLLNATGPFNVHDFPNSGNSSPTDGGTFYFPENPIFSEEPTNFNFSSMASPNICEDSIFVFPEPMLNSPLSDQEETEIQEACNNSDQSFMSTSESVSSDTSNKPSSWLPTSIDNIYRPYEQQPKTGTKFDNDYSSATGESLKNVYRSSSDVSSSTPEAVQKRRERKERPYKSDPFAGGKRPSQGQFFRRNRGLPSDDGFTEDWIEEANEDEAVTLEETEADRKRRVRMSVVSDASTDSGVIGQDSQEVPPSPTGSSGSYGFTTKMGDNSGFSIIEPTRDDDNEESIINSVNKESRKTERKDIIIEIRDTEKSYGRDLHILKDHFYKPMKTNGLLSSDQVEAIFLNLEQLIQANTQFTAKLDVALQDAINSDDLDFVEVSIGNLFLKSTDLMMAFESYCVNQSHAGNLLEQLEKEKELLRIFLQASQDDNVALRRMPLKSFLILPVQRIMRYPLLLERLYKSTSSENPDKMAIMSAKAKMEEILAHINSKTQKSSGSMKMKKKVADLLLQRQAHSMEKVELNRAAIDILGWNKKDVCDITTCRLQVAVSADHWATKRPRHKFSTVQGILLTLGKGELHQTDVDDILFPRKTQVIQAAVVLLKEKNGKYQTLREPFMLNRCIVNHDPDSDDTFEVVEINKEPFVFKGEDTDVKLWLKNMKQQTIDLASWRKRRNALPNIMIKHLV